MSCKTKEHLIIRYTEGQLSPEEQKTFHRHLTSCEACLKKVQILEALSKEASTFPQEKANVLPSVKVRLSSLPHSKGSYRLKKLIYPLRRAKILKPALMIVCFVLVCSLLWPLISKSVVSLFNERFRESPNQQQMAGDTTPIPPMPTPESKPAITPSPAERPTFTLGFYRSTLSYEEILSLSQETSNAHYESIPMEEIELKEEPFLTDLSIEGYISNSQGLRVSQEAFDELSMDLLSAGPIPFVVTLSGERLFWGVFIHPISSVAAPELPLLTISLESEGRKLTLNHLEISGINTEKALIQFFESRHKLEQQIIYETLPHQKTLELVNFNSSNLDLVTLSLPEGWHADRREYEPVYNFTWNVEKNNSVKKLREFQLYFDEKLEDTYYWGERGRMSGELHLQGFYNESTYPGLMFNHATLLKEPLKRNSLLGEAWVYLLECDNYPAAMAEEKSDIPPTFKMIFVAIPIEGENLAYALSVPIPEGMDSDTFYPYVEQILGLS